jgi:succinate dehydrogenase/fumarate reductase flavoprotein subunit
MPDSILDVDVAIIGGGGAGIPAAIEVARAGGKAVVVEQADSCGGTAAISGGGCCIVGTPLQKAQGVEDTPDLAFEDWVKWGQGAADEVWARFYLEHTLHDLYHWAENCGAKWVDMKSQEGNRVLRWHRPDNNGLGLMTALIKTAESLPNIKILMSTTAGQLLIQDRRVCGVTATSNKNETIEIHSKTVVVATGGFNSNLDMVLEHRPEFKKSKVMEGSGFGAKGTGHKMIRELGGYFTHMENIWFYVYATPDYRDPQGRRGLVFRLTPGYVWFNQQGDAFITNLTGGASATPALLRQNPPHAWAILDTPMTAKMKWRIPISRRRQSAQR